MKNTLSFLLTIALYGFSIQSCQKESLKTADIQLQDIDQKKVKIKSVGLKDIEGNKYSTVKIGTQNWMADNLNVATYRNGDPIRHITNQYEWEQSTEGAWCYYQNLSEKGLVYGKMYNWYAVNDPRGLAPEGWHVPSETEWTVLFDFLGGASVAGDAMKTTGSLADGTGPWSGTNSTATNSSGFSAVPAGGRNVDASFTGSDTDFAFLWSSTLTTNGAIMIFLSSSGGMAFPWPFSPNHGFSVRCLED